MQNFRLLAVLAVLIILGFAAYWLGGGFSGDGAPTTMPTSSSAEQQPASGSEAATGAAPEEPQPTAPARITATPESMPTAAAAALVGKVTDEQGLPVVGATVNTGMTATFSPRNFGTGDFDWQDANRMAQRMRERLATRAQVTTAADGTFRLVPDGDGAQLQIEAKARAFQIASRFVDRPTTKDVDVGTLVLPRGAVIAGRVIDNANQPIEGASVMRIAAASAGQPGGAPTPGQRDGAGGLRFGGGGGPLGAMFGGNGADMIPGELLDVMRGFLGDVLTDADGRFEMQNAAPGEFSLRVRHSEHPSASRDGLVAAPGETVPEVLIVLAPGADIRGVVKGIPDGTKDVRVLCAPVTDAQFPAAGTTPGAAGGEAFAQMGAQFAEMLGDFAIAAERSAEPRSDGSFALRGLPVGKRYRVWVTQGARGFANNNVCSQRIEVESGATGIELLYDPGIVVTFDVVDGQSNAPVEQMVVRNQFDGGNDMMAMAQGFLNRGGQLRRYEGGKVTIPSLRPKKGQQLRVTIEAVGYRRFEQRDIALPANGSLDLGTIKLASQPIVRVEVRNQQGAPVVGATVRLRTQQGGGNDPRARIEQFVAQAGGRNAGPFASGANGGIGTQKTDDQGVALLNQPTGDFAVAIEDDGYAPYRSAELQPATTAITHAAVLLRGGTAVVRVLDGDDRPLANARIEHQTPTGDDAPANADGDGMATFARLAPGTHRFRIGTGNANANPMAAFGGRRRGNGDAAAEANWLSVEITDGQRTECTLSKAATATLTGCVRENGQPVTGARVQFRKGSADEPTPAGGDPIAEMMRGGAAMFGGGARGERTDAEGRYTLKELPAGQHRVRVTTSGRSMPITASVVLRLGQNTLDITIESASIAGVVVGPDGQPIAAANVRVTTVDDTSIAMADLMPEMPFGRRGGGGAGAAATQVQTDAQGHFELKGVQPGVPLVVRASKKGLVGGASTPVEVAAGGTAANVEVRLERGGTIQVSTTSSQPFQLVVATYDGTDAQGVPPAVAMLNGGKGTLDGLRPGPWKITLRQGMGGGLFGGGGGGGQGGNRTPDPVQTVTIAAGQTIDVTL